MKIATPEFDRNQWNAMDTKSHSRHRRNALERALDYCTRFNIFFIYGIYASSSNLYVSVLLAERAENTETERRLHSAL